MRRAWLALVLLGSCGGGVSSYATDADLKLCVDEINRYRAMAGKPALTRAPELERYALAAAAADGVAGVPRLHLFQADAPLATGELEFPFTSLRGAGSLANLIVRTAASVWSENDVSEAKQTLLGPYTQLGCGAYLQRDELTLVEAFH